MLWDSHFLKVASVFSILKKIQTFTFFRRILWTPSPPLQGLWLSPRPHFEHTVMKWNRGCRWFTPPVRASAACLKWFYCRSNCLNTINDEGNPSVSSYFWWTPALSLLPPADKSKLLFYYRTKNSSTSSSAFAFMSLLVSSDILSSLVLYKYK